MSLQTRLCLTGPQPLDELSVAARRLGIDKLIPNANECLNTASELSIACIDLTISDNESDSASVAPYRPMSNRLSSIAIDVPLLSIAAGPRTAIPREAFHESVRSALEWAEQTNTRIAIRNTLGSCIEQPADIATILADFPPDQLLLDINIADAHLASVNPNEFIWGFESRIGMVRLTNTKQHTPAALSDGEIDMRQVATAMLAVRYEGPIALPLRRENDVLERLAENVKKVRTLFP